MDGISDQSQGPRRQHSMISRFPAVSRASGEALGVGQSQRSPVSSSELGGPQHLQASGRSTVSASKEQVHGAPERILPGSISKTDQRTFFKGANSGTTKIRSSGRRTTVPLWEVQTRAGPTTVSYSYLISYVWQSSGWVMRGREEGPI